MATLFDVTYDAVADGAAVPDSASGGEWNTVTGTILGETDYAVASTRGAKITSQATCRMNVTATNKWRMRWFQQLPVAAPGANASCAVARSGTTVRAQVRVESSGTYRLVNGSTAVGSSSDSITADVMDRLEWAVDGDAGTQELHIFRGSNRHGSTPDQTLSGTYTNATADNIGTGWFNNVTNYVVGQDSVRCTDTPGTLIGGTAQDATVAAPRVAAAASVPAPQPSLGAVVTPAVVAAVATVQPLQGQTGSTVSPDVVAAVATVPAPTVTAVRTATVAAPVVDAYATIPAAQILTPLDATVTPAVVAAVVAIPAVQRAGPPLGAQPSIDDLVFAWLSSRTTGATRQDRERNYYATQTGLPASTTSLAQLKRTYYGTQLGLTATQVAQRNLTELEFAYWQSVDATNNTGSWVTRARRFYSS